MTVIANAISSLFAAIGLFCAIIFALAVFALYSGHETEFAKVACALQTDGVAEYSTCMYNANASS